MNQAMTDRLLDVDLSTQKIETRVLRPEARELYIGGRGLGARLLYDETPPGLDPYDDRMAIIFSVGPLTGTGAPQSNRFVVTTKSPATGLVADSHCGGNFATKLRKAGYAAVIVRGRSPKPVYLEITDQKVELKDASRLWGKGTEATQAALPKTFGKAVIGPAGENRVRYACIVSQTRVAGRAGTGAVMGAKNLKAIIADGNQPIPNAEPEDFKALQKSITKFLLGHPMTGKILPTLGTANLTAVTERRNIIPTRNYQAGHHERTSELAGERMRDQLLVKQDGCIACPIKCGRHVRAHGREGKGPEFETIGLIGNNLEIFDLETVAELGQLCDDLGLDTISMGSSLGFVTELTERGLMKSDLAWGQADVYRAAIEATARRDGLGDLLAEGVQRIAQRHGGSAYAIHVKGLELPAYDPRGCFGQGLEYATNNRGGCHIRGSTMFLEATGPVSIDPRSPRAKPELVMFQQNSCAAVSSLVMCYFSAFAAIPSLVFDMDPESLLYKATMRALLEAGPVVQVVLKVRAPVKVLWWERFLSLATGRSVSLGEFMEIGNRIYNLERLYNLREGMDPSSDTLPWRLLNEPSFEGARSGVPLSGMLERYYRLRGWGRDGVPTEATLRKLQVRA